MSDNIPAHLKPASYRVTCRCLRCGTIYTRSVRRITAPDPPCPNKTCREAAAAEERARMEANIRQIIESERAPSVGGAIVVKAIDETAKIVMEDHKLTDLRDDVRPGETATPKLPPHQQARVDGFFGGNKKVINPVLSNQISLMGARAMAGSYAPPQGQHITDFALSEKHGPILKPKVKIVAG